MVDTLGLGPSAAMRGGSSPLARTKLKGFVPLVKQLSKWCPGCPKRHKTIKGLHY